MVIAICDDNPVFLDKMQKMVGKIASDDLIMRFESGFSLLDYTARPHNQLDILFLDMKMPRFDGLSTAHELRENRPDIKVIVTTGYPDYARKCYEFYPFYFLEKPVNQEILRKCLDRARLQINDDDFILLQFKNEFRYVPVYGIFSIERVGSRLHFTMKDEAFTVSASRKSLDYYASKLEGKGFFRLHRDTLVSLKYIQTVSELSVHMKNGMVFKVSERKRSLLLDILIVWRHVYA